MDSARLHNMVRVGENKLVGEIIRLQENQATIQVYEDTSGLRIGEPIEETGQPLVAELGPGLMGGIFDGLQRPLTRLAELSGDFLVRGVLENALNRKKEWQFEPSAAEEPCSRLATSSVMSRKRKASGSASWYRLACRASSSISAPGWSAPNSR